MKKEKLTLAGIRQGNGEERDMKIWQQEWEEQCGRGNFSYQDAVAFMNRLAELGEEDPEISHQEADKILCFVLEATGHVDLVRAFHKVAR